MTWIQTYSGDAFDFNAALQGVPQPIHLCDISWPLARICRFMGHVRMHVSVAEHSIIVARLALESDVYAEQDSKGKVNMELRALLHDAHEAYTGDVSRPLKVFARRAGVALIDELEAVVQRQIEDHFGIDASDEDVGRAIKHADNRALAAEKARILGPGPRDREWDWLPPPGIAPVGMDAAKAQRIFSQSVRRVWSELSSFFEG